MNVWNTNRINAGSGVLFRRRPSRDNSAIDKAGKPTAVARRLKVSQRGSRGKHSLAFAGVYLFTLLVYSRPHEVIPGLFGGLPMPKFVAIDAILIYIVSKLRAGEPLIIWTTELKMMALLWALGLLSAPLAASPGDSFNVLFDPLIKILIIFAMQATLIDTRSRYLSMMSIMVFCQALYSFSSINTFLTGGYSEMSSFHARISGWGQFLKNPND